MEDLVKRLIALGATRDRFTYDVRGGCLVYSGIVAAYRATQDSDHFIDLPKVIGHALEHDGIIGAWKNPEGGRTYYDSCRLFTDTERALHFAREQGQRSVFNLNRNEEVLVLGHAPVTVQGYASSKGTRDGTEPEQIGRQ